MVKRFHFWILSVSLIAQCGPTLAQKNASSLEIDSIRSKEIDFVSDTQAPMRIETILLKENQNKKATQLIFNDIAKQRPHSLFLLGDVVSLGRKENRWKEMDGYLKSLKGESISYYGILGNHDVMGNARRGTRLFNQRFPDQVSTGYFVIVDSVGVILLNSNFKKLSKKAQLIQQAFYTQTLHDMDENAAVKIIIVTCHHAPYSNSTIVGSSLSVQEKFVPLFNQSKKAKVFITGHAHVFELFELKDKYFVTIGGGGGLHQPLMQGEKSLPNKAKGYNPEFHYLAVKRKGEQLEVISRELTTDFGKFETGYKLKIN